MSDPHAADITGDEKAEYVQYEAAPQVAEPDDVVQKQIKAVDQGLDVQLKSEFDQLSILQAMWTFRRTAALCAIAAFCASTDGEWRLLQANVSGYQNQLVGSIVANKGFIYQFASDHTTINPSWVSAFGGVFTAGQLIGQFFIQWVGQGLGRKAAMWTFTFFLLLAVIVESVSTQWWHWTIAKLLSGIGIGSVQATIPVVRADGSFWRLSVVRQ